MHAAGGLWPCGERPVHDSLHQQARYAHQVRVLADAGAVHDVIGQQHYLFGSTRKLEAAPLGAQHDGITLHIRHGHVDRRQVRAQW